jgi:hypothetical protein
LRQPPLGLLVAFRIAILVEELVAQGKSAPGVMR